MRWLCDNRETQVNEFEREITGVSVQHPATQTVRDSQDDAQLSLLGDAQQVSLERTLTWWPRSAISTLIPRSSGPKRNKGLVAACGPLPSSA